MEPIGYIASQYTNPVVRPLHVYVIGKLGIYNAEMSIVLAVLPSAFFARTSVSIQLWRSVLHFCSLFSLVKRVHTHSSGLV